MNHLIWTVLLLAYGGLCGCTGAAISTWTRRHPDAPAPGAGLLPDPATMAAMNALRANHHPEFIRLLNAEAARLAGRPASERPGQDGDPS